MKAKIQPKIKLENRTKLQDVIPLKTPFIIMIEPVDICNFHCIFCPNGNIELLKNTNRNLGFMDMNLYKKIINDISFFDDRIKDLRLYGNGESLLHKDFSKMVEYAKNANIFDRIKVTTNAYCLTEELSLNIIEAGLDRIEISIEGLNEEEYYNFAKVKINFNKLIDNIKFFYKNKKQCEVFIKISKNNPTEEFKNKFYDIFGNMADIIHIDNITDIWNGYNCENLSYSYDKSTHSQEININKKICPQIFYTMHISSDGKVVSCFSDYKKRNILGDLLYENVKDIWLGRKLTSFQKMFLKGGKDKHPICKDCKHHIYENYDDIDEYADILLKKYKNNEDINI